MFQKHRTLTLTNGTIKHLDADYEQLNIRGVVSLHQELHLKKYPLMVIAPSIIQLQHRYLIALARVS